MGRNRININESELEQLYLRDGLSAQTIAKRLGVGEMTIHRRLVEFGIPTRNSGWTGHSRLGANNPSWRGGVRLDMGYVDVKLPDHLRADTRGYVRRSILAWEKANNRPFPEDKEPHHKNEIKTDDRPENIQPLTHSEHTKLHHLLRRNKMPDSSLEASDVKSI